MRNTLGGMPSPNPSFPEKIKSVTGHNEVIIRGNNIFDRQNADENTILAWATGVNFTENKGITSDFINVQNISNIISNYRFFIFYYDKNKTYVGNSEDLRKEGGIPYYSTNIVKTNGIVYCRLVFRSVTNNNEDMTNTNIMVNTGTTLLAYETYTSQTLPLDLSSKNLLKNVETSQTINGITFTVNADKSITLNGTATANALLTVYGEWSGTKIYQELDSSKTYTLSGTTLPNTQVQIFIRTTDGSTITSHNLGASPTFTGQIGIVNYFIQVLSGTILNNAVIKPMLNEGSTALEYIPYYKYELNKIGNYQDYIYKNNGNWYKKEYIGQRIANNIITTGTTNVHIDTTFSDDYLEQEAYCTHLINRVDSRIVGNYDAGAYMENNEFSFRVGTTKDRLYIKSTLSANELNTLNMVVYYVKATAIDIPITETNLISQLNAIEQAYSYEGTTIIYTTFDDDNSQAYLDIDYIQDYDLEVFDEKYLKDVNVDFGEKYGPINSIVLSRSAESDNVFIQDGESVAQNGLCEIKIKDNQIMNFNDRSDYLPDILEKLDGLQYYINDFSSTGICYLDLLDKYRISIRGMLYDCVMFNDEQNINLGLEEIIHTDMPEESETDYTKADKTDRRINQTYLIVDKQNQEIQSLVNQIGDRSEKQTSLTQDVDSLELKVSDIEDLTLEVNGTNPILLENCLQGNLLQFKIRGNNTVFSGLLPSNTLTPSNELLPRGDSIIKIYTNNVCPTEDNKWEKNIYDVSYEIITKTSRWYLSLAHIAQEGIRAKLGSSSSYSGYKTYYFACKKQHRYKIIADVSSYTGAFIIATFGPDVLTQMDNTSITDIEANSFNSNASYSGDFVYDTSIKELELTTNNDDEYLFIQFTDMTKISIYDLTSDSFGDIINRNPIEIDKTQDMYFALKGNIDYYVTDILYYDANKNYLGNYEDIYSETIEERELQAIYPNNASYYKFKIQKIEDGVPVADDFIIENIKPMLSNSLDYDYVQYNLQVIDLGITEPLRQLNSTVYDEFVYDYEDDNYLAKVIRRVGVTSGGELYELANEIIEPIQIEEILLMKGNNYIDIGKPYLANCYARYVQVNDFTKQFATTYEVESMITQLANSITLLVREKVNKDEVIAELNLEISEGKGIVRITGNQVIIDSDYFHLTADGRITTTAGQIGNLILENGRLYKNFTVNGVTYQSGLYIPTTSTSMNDIFLYAGRNLSDNDYAFRIGHNGVIFAKYLTVDNDNGYLEMKYTDTDRVAMSLKNMELQFRLNDSANNLFGRIYRAQDDLTIGVLGALGFCIRDELHSRNLYNVATRAGQVPYHYFTGEMWMDRDLDGNFVQVAQSGDWSDERLKEDIEDCETNALDIIDRIPFKQFTWNNTAPKKGVHVDIGIIAQDIEKIDENYIENTTRIYQGEEQKLLSIDVLNLLTTTTKAVQELNQKVKELEEEIKRLKGEE